MNTTVTALVCRELDEALGQIFEPLRYETLEDLFRQHATDADRMREIASIITERDVDLVRLFVFANLDNTSYVPVERMFTLDPALRNLDAHYWDRALRLTDVFETMPQARRDEWCDLIKERRTPRFETATVVSTLQDMLAQRHRFFAERVDGVFRALSHEHVTNRPEGFSRRMIIAYVVRMGIVDFSRCGTINDLRCVIAKFFGRVEPRYIDTNRALDLARRERVGQWVSIDGGALRIRVYLNGNAHLEVHPEIAWRLNAVLASLYPTAIAEEHRRRPRTRAPKDFKLFVRPLPSPVLALIGDGRTNKYTFQFQYDSRKDPAYREACQVLTILGGEQRDDGTFVFDYLPDTVIREVVASGVLPDQRSHQYYPTPADLAERVVALAAIEPHHSVLEPSAGQGGLVSLLPMGQTTAVEVATIHCEILRAKGIAASVIQADFLSWMPRRRYDRIVMNPPFDRGQWQRHLEHAAELASGGGRIVAVLPASARSKDVLPGWRCTWQDAEPFPGTSIEVAILVADRPGASL